MESGLHQLFTEVEVLKAKHIERDRELATLSQALKEHMLAEIAERKESNERMLQLEKKQALWSGGIMAVIFFLNIFDIHGILSGLS